MQSALNVYQQNSVNIESPNKLIEMLYEGVLRFITQAKKSILDDDIEIGRASCRERV